MRKNLSTIIEELGQHHMLSCLRITLKVKTEKRAPKMAINAQQKRTNMHTKTKFECGALQLFILTHILFFLGSVPTVWYRIILPCRNFGKQNFSKFSTFPNIHLLWKLVQSTWSLTAVQCKCRRSEPQCHFILCHARSSVFQGTFCHRTIFSHKRDG